MTRDRIIDFLQQSSGIASAAHQAREHLNQGLALKQVLEATGSPEKVLELSKQLEGAETQFTKTVGALLKKTRAESFDSAETLIQDISTRLDFADKAFAAWRQSLAAHELNARTGVYVDAESRVESEKTISDLKARYEAALAAAAEMVPSPGVVIL